MGAPRGAPFGWVKRHMTLLIVVSLFSSASISLYSLSLSLSLLSLSLSLSLFSACTASPPLASCAHPVAVARTAKSPMPPKPLFAFPVLPYLLFCFLSLWVFISFLSLFFLFPFVVVFLFFFFFCEGRGRAIGICPVARSRAFEGVAT